MKNSGAPHSSSMTCASSWQMHNPQGGTADDKGERVGGGAGGDEKDRDLMVEDLREPCLDARGERVVAIGRHGPRIGPHESLHDGRAGAHDVVAGEIHRDDLLRRSTLPTADLMSRTLTYRRSLSPGLKKTWLCCNPAPLREIFV